MAWSRLQSCYGQSTGGAASATATFGTNLSSGTKLIAVVNGDPFVPSQCTGISDGNGNNFTKVADTGFSNSGGPAALWVLDTPAGDVGTKPTITATWGNNTAGIDLAVLVQEVSGLAAGTSASLDGTAGTLNNNGASPASTGSPSYSSTAANEYLLSAIGGFGSGDATGLTPGAGTADPNNQNGSVVGSDAFLGFAYGNSTNGAETDGWTLTGDGGYNGWGVILVAFQLASGGTTVSGAVSPLALAAPTGTITASGGASGQVAPLTLAAPAGSVVAGTVVSGQVAPLALAAPAGTVQSSGVVIAGPVAALALAAPAGGAGTPGHGASQPPSGDSDHRGLLRKRWLW